MKPYRFKVGYTIYEIRYPPFMEMSDDDGADCFGRHHEHGLIEISSSYSEEEQRVTLLHEFIHALSRHYGFELNESVIRGLSHALFEAFQNNKNGFKWIQGEEEE